MHFAVGRWVSRSVINRAWGRGSVHIKLLGHVPVGAGALGEARQAARYLSKYVSKTFTDPSARVLGLHHYGLAQGFQPEKITLRGRSPEDVLDQASDLFGSRPTSTWSSADAELWSGPPAIWAQWAG